jgi:hypothetical protein
MWSAVVRDPDRGLGRLLAERFYMEDWETSAPGPSPRRAFHRVRISLGGRGDLGLFVVNRQFLQPVQDKSLWDNQEGSGGFEFYFGVLFLEEELVFDRRWRFLDSRRWGWSGGVPENSWRDEQERLVAERQRLGFYPLKLTPSYGEVRVQNDEVVDILDGKGRRTFALDRSVPSWEALEILFGLAADVVKGAKVTCQSMATGERFTYAIRGADPEARDSRGKPTNEIWVWPEVRDISEYAYSFKPPSGEVQQSNNVVLCTLKRTTREVYEGAVGKFLSDFRITALTDKEGKPVDLPLGLKNLTHTTPTATK